MTIAACCAAFLLPVSVHAQTATDFDRRARDARLHVGPLALEPRLALRNLGVDTNALNEELGATRDVTATIRPELTSWLRVGRLGLTGGVGVDWNYYRTLEDQRSFDASESMRADLFLTYVQPYLTGAYERTRQRPNLEIDARVLRSARRAGGGVLVRVGAKTSLDLGYEQRRIDYGAAFFGGVSLAEALNHEELETSLTGRFAATPLTTLSLAVRARRDRFDLTPERNTDSLAVMPGIELEPLALISGRAAVGFRRFEPKSADVQAYEGLVSDVELSYVFRDRARLTMTVNRDVDYSFEPSEPYYVATGAGATIVQALGGSWDAVGRLSRTTLDYRALRVVELAEPNRLRTDRVTVIGVGIGRRLGEDVRVGIDVDHAERRSSAPGRSYEGMRVGGSVTYGFQ